MNKRTNLLIISLAVAAFGVAACGDFDATETAEVNVVVQYETASDVVAVRLPVADPGGTEYTFLVTPQGSSVGADPGVYWLRVSDESDVVFSTTFEVPHSVSGAQTGSTGSGSVVHTVVPGVNNVTVPFVFDGQVPNSTTDVDVDFSTEPIINAWGASPGTTSPGPDILVTAFVSFENPTEDDRVTAQLYNSDGTAVGTATVLDEDLSGEFSGKVTTSGVAAGEYTLRLIAEDGTTEAQNQDDLPYTINP